MPIKHQNRVRAEREAMLLFEQSCALLQAEERLAMIAGAFLPLAIRRKALRMMELENLPEEAFVTTMWSLGPE